MAKMRTRDASPLDKLTNDLRETGIYLEAPPTAFWLTIMSIVANWLDPRDPVWLMLVGASGSGKTLYVELFKHMPIATPQRPYGFRYVADVKGVASLLSGTPSRERAKGASGGIMGDIRRGIVAWPDFTSLLSLNKLALTEFLGALRHIYMGNWSRDVASDGGKSLVWNGKVGMLAGVTSSAIDEHQTQAQQMGERWVYARLASGKNDTWQQSTASAHGYQVDKARNIVRDFMRHFDFEKPGSMEQMDKLSQKTISQLTALAEWACAIRSTLRRDNYTKEITAPPERETPTRWISILVSLFQAGKFLEMPESIIWNALYHLVRSSTTLLKIQILGYLEWYGDGKVGGTPSEGGRAWRGDGVKLEASKIISHCRVSPNIFYRAVEEMEVFGALRIDKGTGRERGLWTVKIMEQPERTAYL